MLPELHRRPWVTVAFVELATELQIDVVGKIETIEDQARHRGPGHSHHVDEDLANCVVLDGGVRGGGVRQREAVQREAVLRADP